MSILITLLTTVLVLNCFFLVLLILIQLPKKESGSGLAFGGGALDMALGAGAGNVLTRFTKYSASLFLILCLVLAVIGNNGNKSALESGLSEAPKAANLEVTKPPTAPGTPGPAGTEVPATAPGTPENTDNTETPTGTEITPTPDAATTENPETPAQPAEGEEEK
ncbi:MAG: preprotein translocase subunit SecG [Pedosphaera sp.]|jgi:preprotein translocase subunit SecG|nr:preprotein translocase subunit SecG [Pedosphaera sp.]|tara:strand:+ start:48 stop:542 length:495 start_codon:yes stop_codon:yes gene_type:complete